MTPSGDMQHTFLDFDHHHATRSFVLLGIGLILGLGIAGFGLFTATGTSTLIVAPEDVASVNQRSISRIDFNAQLQALYDVTPGEATPEQRRKVLDDMIREELFVQRGLELDLAGFDPSLRTALVAAVEQQIAADAMTRVPTTSDLQTYYTKHQAEYLSEGRLTAVDLIADSPEHANAAVQVLRAGQPWTTVMARPGMRNSGKMRDEEFYFAAKIHLGESLFAAAAALNNGEVSAPIVQPDGLHVLVVVRNIKPAAVPFESARERVLSDWRRDNSARLLRGDEAFLRKRASILIAEDLR